jgi:hypothetical protein
MHLDDLTRLATLVAVLIGFAGVFMRAGALVAAVERVAAKTEMLENRLAEFVTATEKRLAVLERIEIERQHARRNSQ